MDRNNLKDNIKVIAYQSEVKKEIEENFNFDIINQTGNVTNYAIHDRKQ